MDTLTLAERSKRMALIRGANTKPELRVRSITHQCGYRYRLHVSSLPGKPDLVFPRLRKVIFVHGCFWHRHPGCTLARLPKSRLSFWLPKLTNNRQRDVKNIARLRRAGWKVKVIWECETKSAERIEKKLRTFLEEKR
jgi:DNA mismatch endonuclease (patch repair protein)